MSKLVLKIITVGDISVGKSSIYNVFLYQTMYNYHSFCSISFPTKKITMDHREIILELWDTSGQERYHSLPPIYYRGSNGVILTYDITNRQSFDRLRDVWYTDVCQYSSNETQCILIGNKCDMECERAVEYSTGKLFADSLNIPFIETSAKENLNVEESFVLLTAVIMRKLSETETRNENDIVLETTVRGRQHPVCYC